MEKHTYQKYSSKSDDYYVLYSTTKENVPKQYSNHIHNFYEIIFILNGSGTYGTDEFSVSLLPYDLIVTPASTYHFLSLQYDKSYERISIHTKKKELNALLEKNLQSVQGILNIEGHKILTSYISKLKYCFQLQDELEPKHYDKLMRHNVEELIFYLSTFPAEYFSKNDNATNHPPILTEIVNYIANDLQNVSIHSIATKFRISSTYVCILFKKYLHTAPSNYIISKRLAYATTLIENGEKIHNAAYACGYQNYSSFYRAYQKVYGIAPSQIGESFS